jgi:hypothetical protein
MDSPALDKRQQPQGQTDRKSKDAIWTAAAQRLCRVCHKLPMVKPLWLGLRAGKPLKSRDLHPFTKMSPAQSFASWRLA